ncbi:MAG: hypothetical protein ABGU93_05480 [Acetobacterium sp.]|uniref:hypothetical protein n=1 Tax=Acetobacterium sp. TaxID=1872094 RepID=UPI003241DB13
MPRYLKINKAIFCEKYWRVNDRQRGLPIDSEAFPDVLRYVVKDQDLILLSGIHGVFGFDMAAAPTLLNEIGKIIDCYHSGERLTAAPTKLGKSISQFLQIPTD